MESYKCRVCSKSFVNGRALGGHMRSHRLSVDEEEEQVERASQLSDENESHVSSSSSDRKRNGLRKNDPKLTFNGSALLEDDESETEPSRNINNLTRIRSKRTGKVEAFATKKVKTSQVGYKTEPELEAPHSSASDTTTEEDLAFCLMMLSRDEWKKNNKEVVEEIEKEESKGYNKSSKINRTTTKGRYKCETCEKVFKSYQALGGHRASHKKNRVCTKTEYDNVVVVDAAEKRIHECPICLRVFASGQALGGHKRSHGVGNLSINYQVDRIEPVKQMMIDLNLPAPNEEDDVSVVFQ